jgi:hypothetical protein
MILNSYLKILILLLVLLVPVNQSLPLRIKGKKTINNFETWTSEWFLKNKNELISLTDQQLKFKFYKELAKFSKNNQNIFNEILSKILIFQKQKRILDDRKYFKV